MGNLFAYARFLVRRRHRHLRPGGDRSESHGLCVLRLLARDDLGLQILFNFPHFIASYRLLYQSKEIVHRYKWASIYLPIVLGSYLLFSLVHPVVFREPVNDRYSHLADLISGMYLAAHYAGQSWGMVASFAYLGGVQIQKIERRVLRTVLLVFVAWHIAIANHLVPKYTLFVPELKPLLDTLFEVITPFAHVAMMVAIAVFVRMGYRTKRVPPLSALVPIPLLYCGYLVFTRGYAGLLLLQVCHALHYLIFPLRVEINRRNVEESQAERKHIVLYVLALIAAGAFVFLGPDAFQARPYRLVPRFFWPSSIFITTSSMVVFGKSAHQRSKRICSATFQVGSAYTPSPCTAVSLFLLALVPAPTGPQRPIPGLLQPRSLSVS